MPHWALGLFDLLVGGILVLSAYVVVRNLKLTFQKKGKLLPLHVWSITVSYLTMCVSFLFAQTDITWVFVMRFIALFIGVYALSILVKHQNTKR